LSSHGAQVFGPGDMLADSCTLDETPKFVLTPHDIPDSQLPSIPEHLLQTATRVTDWWVEICISTKALVLPTQNRFCAPFFNAQISGMDLLFYEFCVLRV
jgi:DNA replication regulator DPB11